jgi:hypothetical protein
MYLPSESGQHLYPNLKGVTLILNLRRPRAEFGHVSKGSDAFGFFSADRAQSRGFSVSKINKANSLFAHQENL